LAFSIYTVKTILERKEAFSSGVRYTIGYTTEMYLTISGRSIKYRYQVGVVEYTGNASYAYNSKVPDGRYWVKFSVAKPSISSIYQDKPVPLSITVPAEGVDSIIK
jgi:hypothetical protein